uniref:Vacuolar protein sorting-associated protein 55-like protein n=1 Tax=Aegilops tauschii subsp. strangulata TaxID=200361 RepID=A0A453GUM6_AEGTS
MLIHTFATITIVIRQGISFFRWMKAAKFLTGMSAMGSLAIPAILRHAGLIETGAMFIEFTSFFILVCTVLCFHRATLDEEW